MDELEIKRTPGGQLLARRKDGLPLTPEDRETVRRLANVQPPAAADDPFRDPAIIATMLEGDQPVAVLIDAKVIGAKVWMALNEDWKPEPGVKTPVFYPSELPALREKSAAHSNRSTTSRPPLLASRANLEKRGYGNEVDDYQRAQRPADAGGR